MYLESILDSVDIRVEGEVTPGISIDTFLKQHPELRETNLRRDDEALEHACRSRRRSVDLDSGVLGYRNPLHI